MRKTRKGPALFELIGDRALAGKAAARHDGGASCELPDSPRDDRCDEVVASALPAPEFRADPAHPDHASADTVVHFDGDRVRISLSSIGAAVATFVAIVFLAGGFLLGKSRGRQDGLLAGYQAGRESFEAGVVNDIEAARNQPPATYLIGGLLENPAAEPAKRNTETGRERASVSPPAAEMQTAKGPLSGQPEWIDGFTYIVAQEFPGSARADAEAAQSYLEQHGVATAIAVQPGGRLLLTTLQGYNRKDPVQRKLSDQLGEKVRAIGAQYYASGGRYKLEGYLKTHKDES